MAAPTGKGPAASRKPQHGAGAGKSKPKPRVQETKTLKRKREQEDMAKLQASVDELVR